MNASSLRLTDSLRSPEANKWHTGEDSSTRLFLECRANTETYRFPMSSFVSNWETFSVIRQINHASLSVSIRLTLFRYFHSSRPFRYFPSFRYSSLFLFRQDSLCFPSPFSVHPACSSRLAAIAGHCQGSRSIRIARLGSPSHASTDQEPRGTFAPEVGIYICFSQRQTDAKIVGEGGST